MKLPKEGDFITIQSYKHNGSLHPTIMYDITAYWIRPVFMNKSDISLAVVLEVTIRVTFGRNTELMAEENR